MASETMYDLFDLIQIPWRVQLEKEGNENHPFTYTSHEYNYTFQWFDWRCHQAF